MEFKDTDRSKEARAKRYREFMELKLLPYRTKEQEGRFQWLKRQRVKDNITAHAEKTR